MVGEIYRSQEDGRTAHCTRHPSRRSNMSRKNIFCDMRRMLLLSSYAPSLRSVAPTNHVSVSASTSTNQQRLNFHDQHFNRPVNAKSRKTMAASQKAVIVGISGVSSSGKTTLARLLRDIHPKTFILHEDDFYKTDTEIPVNKDGVQDWDCLESINLPELEKALEHIKLHGTLPDWLESKEDQNSVGESGVVKERIAELKKEAHDLLSGGQRNVPIAIIDGFLLFSEEMKAVRELFDIKLLLRTDYKTAKSRREARSGYVTLEGFWEDPPGYVDNVVWPNYVKDHAFLFENGDVEGVVKQDVCRRLGIKVMPEEAQGNMTDCVEWAYGVLREYLIHEANQSP